MPRMCRRAGTAGKLVFNFLGRMEQCVTSLQSHCRGMGGGRELNESHILANMEQKIKWNKEKSSPALGSCSQAVNVYQMFELERRISLRNQK